MGRVRVKLRVRVRVRVRVWVWVWVRVRVRVSTVAHDDGHDVGVGQADDALQVLDGRLQARHRLGDLLRIREEPQAKQLVAAVQAEEAVDQPEVAPHQA